MYHPARGQTVPSRAPHTSYTLELARLPSDHFDPSIYCAPRCVVDLGLDLDRWRSGPEILEALTDLHTRHFVADGMARRCPTRAPCDSLPPPQTDGLESGRWPDRHYSQAPTWWPAMQSGPLGPSPVSTSCPRNGRQILDDWSSRGL